jgi:hypothetical protein
METILDTPKDPKSDSHDSSLFGKESLIYDTVQCWAQASKAPLHPQLPNEVESVLPSH